ncbi:hypothetical protein LINGRAHAP2_LOCUS23855, partial [Linum grandiflorum]
MISSDSEYGSSIPESPTEEESSAAVEIEDLEDAYDIKDFEELEEAIELEKAAVVNMSLLLSEKMELQLQGLRQAADDEVLKVACDLFTQKKKVARLTKKILLTACTSSSGFETKFASQSEDFELLIFVDEINLHIWKRKGMSGVLLPNFL